MIRQQNGNYIHGLFYWCKCGICKSTTHFNRTSRKQGETRREVRRGVTKELNYEKLLRSLEGANILIPETIFFHRNIPATLIKYNQSESKIQVINKPKYASMIELFVAKTKRREQTFIEIENNTKVATIVHYKDTTEDLELTDTKFLNLIMLRKNNDEWKRILNIQRYVRNQFYKKVYVFFPSAEPQLQDFYRIQNKVGNPFHEEMRKICEVISKHLMKVYCLELIILEAVFIRDEQGVIWLVDTNRVAVGILEHELKRRKAKQLFERRLEEGKRSIFAEFDRMAKDKKHQINIQRFGKLLDDGYMKVKTDTGIVTAKEIPCSREFKLTTNIQFSADRDHFINTVANITRNSNLNATEVKSLYYKGISKDLRYSKSELRRRSFNKTTLRTKTTTNKEYNRSLKTSSCLRNIFKSPYKDTSRRSRRRTFYISTPS